jgi:hypothetical protein
VSKRARRPGSTGVPHVACGPDENELGAAVPEGITAAAYVILTVVGEAWTLEECGDRDASGARVGALLQALIAREPVERRPTIRAWLPPRFLPPQVTIASTAPSTETIRVRMLVSHATVPPLSGDDVLFWRNDLL